jgi:hypothetical protein
MKHYYAFLAGFLKEYVKINRKMKLLWCYLNVGYAIGEVF